MSYTGRGSIVVICAVAWLWLAVHNVVVPSQITIRNLDQSSSKPLPLPPCENTEPPAAATRLSQILFPVSEPEKNNSWVGENHKALRALFRCMELSNCEPQQKKGACRIFVLLAFLVYSISCYIELASFPRSAPGIGWWW